MTISESCKPWRSALVLWAALGSAAAGAAVTGCSSAEGDDWSTPDDDDIGERALDLRRGRGGTTSAGGGGTTSAGGGTTSAGGGTTSAGGGGSNNAGSGNAGSGNAGSGNAGSGNAGSVGPFGFQALAPCLTESDFVRSGVVRVGPTGCSPACVRLASGGTVVFIGPLSENPVEPRTLGTTPSPIVRSSLGGAAEIEFPDYGVFPFRCGPNANQIGVIWSTYW